MSQSRIQCRMSLEKVQIVSLNLETVSIFFYTLITNLNNLKKTHLFTSFTLLCTRGVLMCISSVHITLWKSRSSIQLNYHKPSLNSVFQTRLIILQSISKNEKVITIAHHSFISTERQKGRFKSAFPCLLDDPPTSVRQVVTGDLSTVLLINIRDGEGRASRR